MKFKIDRSKWRTGHRSEHSTGTGSTYLLNENGYSCCLGFCMNQLGYDWNQLENVACPDVIDGISLNPFIKEEEEGVYRNSNLTSKFMRINDASYTTPQEKEELLKKASKSKGLEIEFYGEY